MLRIKENQCVVISGESGSGKTESTNFLLHHLTTLSQKGSSGTTVEQTLLSAGPVLEVKKSLCMASKIFFRLLEMLSLYKTITVADLENLLKLIIGKMEWFLGKIIIF